MTKAETAILARMNNAHECNVCLKISVRIRPFLENQRAMIKLRVGRIRSLVSPLLFVVRTRGSRALACFFLSSALLGQFGLIAASNAADSRLDSPNLLRDRALQNALKHSQQPEDIQRSLNLYKAAIERSEKEYGADSTYTAQLYYEMGSFALDNSKFTVALESLNRAVVLDPNAITPRLQLVKLYELRKEPNAARVQLIQLLKKHPDSKVGRQLLVNEIQNSDPAAATKQAFRMDKLLLAAINPVGMPANLSVSAVKPATTGSAAKPATGSTQPNGASATDQLPKVEPKAIVPAEPLSSVMLLRMHQKPAPTPPPQEQTAQVTPVQAPVVKPPIITPAKIPMMSHPPKSATRPKKAQPLAKAQSGIIANAERPSRHEKPAGKVGKGGLVPPPPPLPFVPVFPGMIPPPQARTPVGVPAVQLKTDAKIKSPPKKESKPADGAAKQQATEVPAPPKATAPGASKPSADDDPEFLLKWASVSQKKKGAKGAASKEAPAKEAPAKEAPAPAKEAPKETAKEAPKETPKEAAPKETPKEAPKEAPKESKEAKDAN